MNRETVWAVIALSAVATAIMKGIGPAATGTRTLPAAAVRVIQLFASALLAALVVTSVLADDGRLRLGADTAGIVTAVLLLWMRAQVLIVVLGAAGTTAVLRAAGIP